MATLLSSSSSHLLRPTSSSSTSFPSSLRTWGVRISNNNAFSVTTRMDTNKRQDEFFILANEIDIQFVEFFEYFSRVTMDLLQSNKDSVILMRNLVCAVNQEAEDAFKKMVEVDRLIDMLKSASDQELQKLVVENILAYNEGFWIRLAARTDTCKSDDDKQDLEELASSVMTIVDRVVHKTNEKIESATDVLKGILRPVVNEVEEICWPPRDPNALNLMEKEVNQREQEGQLDEGFLAEVNAQLRQAKEDGDKPGLEAMLQKVLQLYASRVLSKRSYAMKGDEVIKAERCLEEIIKAPESEWNKVLIDHLSGGKGDISPDELYAVIKKRIERTLIRTEGGSYQQRIIVEFLKGIQSRTEEIVQGNWREPLAPVPHWVPIIPPRKGYDAGKIPPLDTARIWAMPASFQLPRLAQGSTAAGTSEGWLDPTLALVAPKVLLWLVVLTNTLGTFTKLEGSPKLVVSIVSLQVTHFLAREELDDDGSVVKKKQSYERRQDA
ncbi:hypothetical protein E3N88_41405 [Mikania micrantha]|uniref:Uncharacterized protein n=1 Tax=Mikania micrantha TaxID=192012 RepID=A0A5N6LSM0_9ASTR|nr:hypothetical protein E3N88_41405 [Mikania micrantha]